MQHIILFLAPIVSFSHCYLTLRDLVSIFAVQLCIEI